MVNLAAPLRTLLAIGAAAGVVVGASHTDVRADWGRPGDRVATADRASTALQSVQVCAGPDRPGTPGFEKARQNVTVATAFAPADLLQDAGSTGRLTTTTAPAAGSPDVLTSRTAPAPMTLDRPAAPVLVGTGRLALGVTATQAALEFEPTVTGLAMSACRAPVHEAWIPLGGNQVGRLDRAVLTNPSSSPITVDVAVVGHHGAVSGKGASNLVVPAHDRRVVSIGDFGDDLADAMLHVTSSGGPVGVTVADALMMGERRAGESLAGPTAPPSENQTIPAFVVAAGSANVRVAVPGPDAATVRVQAMDTSGNVVADEVQEVAGGTTGAVPLTGAGRGTYAVRVTADVPVVAAGLAVTGTTGSTDLAWATSTEPVTRLGGLALPPLPAGLTASLVLAPGERTQRVLVVTGSSRRDVTVPSDRPVVLDITGESSIWVTPRGGGQVTAGVVVAGERSNWDLLEILPVQPVVSAAKVRDVTADAG